MDRARTWTARLAVSLVVAVGCSSPPDPQPPARDTLITLARQGDPTLDPSRAACIVDALTAKLGTARAAAVLQARPPATLAPADSDAVATIGMTCSGAAGIQVGTIPPA